MMEEEERGKANEIDTKWSLAFLFTIHMKSTFPTLKHFLLLIRGADSSCSLNSLLCAAKAFHAATSV